MNLAPHRVNAPSRPDWFFDKARYGGILTRHRLAPGGPIPLLHQQHAARRSSPRRPATSRWPDKPKFEDFGDMVIAGNGGTGYVRVDWFTPDGLPTWGDGRLFVLGTEGYIELRKYVNVASSLKGGNHLYIVDKKQARYIDCKQGAAAVRSAVRERHRESHARSRRTRTQALLAAELVLKAQKNATRPVLRLKFDRGTS